MTTALDLDTIAPPFQMAETDLLLTAVTFDEASLRSHLPAGLEPVPGCGGVIAAYLCGTCYPFGAYTGLYISVDVRGFDAPDGSPGRVMLRTLYGPQPGPAALMSRHLGFPATVGHTRFQRVSPTLRATTTVDGSPVFATEMVVASTSTSAAGSLNWVRQLNGSLVVSAEPWTGHIAEAELVGASLDIDALGGPSVPTVNSFDSALAIHGAAFAFYAHS